jgi:hypothetical protein
MTDSRTIYTKENQEMIMRAFANATGIIEEIATVLEKAEVQEMSDDTPEDEWINPLEKITDIIRRYEIEQQLDAMEV